MTAPVWHRVELYAVRKLHVLVGKGSLELSPRLLLAFMSMTTSGNFGVLTLLKKPLKLYGRRRCEIWLG